VRLSGKALLNCENDRFNRSVKRLAVARPRPRRRASVGRHEDVAARPRRVLTRAGLALFVSPWAPLPPFDDLAAWLSKGVFGNAATLELGTGLRSAGGPWSMNATSKIYTEAAPDIETARSVRKSLT
jgi:hypothetical protein